MTKRSVSYRHLKVCLRRLLISLLLLCSIFAVPVTAQAEALPAQQTEARNILALYSYGHGSRGIAVFDEGLLTALSAGGEQTNDVFFEHLDLERNASDPQYRPRLLDFI